MGHEIPLPMPKMSMTMESGELLFWCKAEGDAVKSGDVLAEVQTDKVNMEVESPVDGVLTRIVSAPGTVVEVGGPIAFITTEAEDLMAGLFDSPSPEPADSAVHAPRPATEPVTTEATPSSRRGPRPAVPFARRRASQLRISMDDVVATGKNGVITVDDVEQAAAKSTSGQAEPVQAQPVQAEPRQAQTVPAQPAQAQPTQAEPRQAQPTQARPAQAPEPVAGPAVAPATDPGFADQLASRRRSVRMAVARTMTASTDVPQFTVFAELDLEATNRERNGVGWTTLLLRALARSLRAQPQINSGWDPATDAPATTAGGVGVALAIDSAIGLLAPVIRDPDLLPVGELEQLVRTTVERTRTGRLTGADLQGATTTLSNLGGFGVPSFTSLLTPPQASALSVGAITPRPVVVGGGLAVRLGTTIGLTVDHRAVDGADAARLLADVQELFARPGMLFS